MTREDWIKLTNENSVNIDIIKKCCELDEKCNLNENEINHYISLLQQHPLFNNIIINSYNNNMKPMLDKHFELHILEDKDGNEIKIL